MLEKFQSVYTACLCRFLVKPDRGAGSRDADSKDAALVLFRSIAGEHLLSQLIRNV